MSEKKELSLQECYAISEQLDIVEADTLRCVGDPAWQFMLKTPAAYADKEQALTRLVELGLIHPVETGYEMSISQENMETIYMETGRKPETAQIAQIGYPILAACIEHNCAPDVFLHSALIPDVSKEYIAEQYAGYVKTGVMPEPFFRLKEEDYTEDFFWKMYTAFLQVYDFDTKEAFEHAVKQEAIALLTTPCCPAFVKDLVEQQVAHIKMVSIKNIQEWRKVLDFNPGYI